MSSVDDRIVNMTFNNKQFTQGVTQTQNDLKKLDSTLANAGKAKGLSTMAQGVDSIKTKFSALQVAGVAALATIVSKATTAGLQFAKSLTIDPIVAGFKEYTTNLNSVQTIMANTGKSVETVNKYLDELNEFSDQTIYNFSEMARNIGTFTAAGVKLDTATSAIKGIANLAALSGSSSQQASTAMYQLSQAIAAGRVGLQDWNSVVNAGMGGKQFKSALARTAVAMGDLSAGAVKVGTDVEVMGSSFRQSISAAPGQTSWLSGDILVSTLATLDGRFSKTKLQIEGYNSEQEINNQLTKERNKLAKEGVVYSDKEFEAVVKMAEASFSAATTIKSLPQLMDVVRESVGSVWANAFELILGDFEQSKKLWTNIGDVITGPSGIISNISKKFLGTLMDWKKAGGRSDLLAGFGNIFKSLGKVVSVFGDAWGSIFEGLSGEDLANLSEGFKNFTAALIPSEQTMTNLGRIFKGFFALLDIGWQVIKGVASVIGDLLGVVASGSGGFLEFAGGIGDMIVNFDKALKSGDGLASFFDGLGTILSIPLELITGLASAVGSLFGGFDKGAADAVDGSLGRISDRISSFSEFAEAARQAVQNFFESVVDFLGPIGEVIGESFSNLGEAIAQSMGSGNFDAVLDVLNTGLFAGLVLLLKKFAKDGLSLDFSGGLFESVKDSFSALTGTMTTMQQNVKADTLMKIAIAIGILTASVVALSLIDSKKMTSALAGMAAGFTELLAAMQILTIVSKSAGLLKVPFIAVSLSMLATSILILSAAIAVMSRLSWDEIARGLTGTAGALTVIALAMRIMPQNMVAQSVALGIIGVALNILARAIKTMGELSMEEIGKGIGTIAASLVGIAGAMRIMPTNILMQAAAIAILGFALNEIAKAISSMSELSWEEIAKGVTAIATSIGAIGLAMKLMPTGMVLQAAALVILGYALKGIGDAVISMSDMSWEEIIRGVTGVAGAIGAIGLAMMLVPVTLPITAAGLVLVGIALKSIGAAIMSMAEMSWEEIGRGLTVLAASLLLIAVATNAMSGALGGAAAMVIVAGALAIMAPVLTTLGGMSWESIAKGLLTLAGVFVIFGVAGYLLAPVTPVLIGLGAALLMFGAGLALAGVGALAFATSFGILVTAGTAGVAILIGAFKNFIKLLPSIANGLGKAFVAFLQVLANNSKKIRQAMGQLLTNMLGTVRDAIPQIVSLFDEFMTAGIRIIDKYVPQFVELGFRVIDSFLKSANRHVPDITDSAISLVVKFINTLANRVGDLADAGANLIVKTINGIANAIDAHAGELRTAGLNLATAIINGLTGGLLSTGLSAVRSAVSTIANAIPNGIRKLLDAHSPARKLIPIGESIGLGLAVGIAASKIPAIAAALDMANAIVSTVNGVVDAGVSAAQRAATKQQGVAFSAQSRADISDRYADQAERRANQLQKKVKKAGSKEAEKAAQKRANAAGRAATKKRNEADRKQTQADNQQAAADAAAQRVVDARAFAEADLLGKAVIKDDLATTLATQSQAMLAKANAEATEADRLQKTNKKQAEAMRARAKKDAEEAARLAAAAEAAHSEAIAFYAAARAEAAQAVRERIAGIRQQQAEEEQTRQEEAAYEAASTQGKADIMAQRAARDKEAARVASEASANYLAQAEAVADADPEKANALVDLAEEQARKANEAANRAADEERQAADLLEQAKQETAAGAEGGTGAGTAGGGTIIAPSRTALEDAAKAVDRYTESLLQAQEAALAGQTTVQFVQNNSSPTALNASEIYRQSKNLLSAQEVKIGASSK